MLGFVYAYLNSHSRNKEGGIAAYVNLPQVKEDEKPIFVLIIS